MCICVCTRVSVFLCCVQDLYCAHVNVVGTCVIMCVCVRGRVCVCVCNCKNVNSSTFERSNRYVCVSVHVCMFVSVYLWFVCVHV